MNSKTKIFTISLVLILGAVLLSGAGCVKKAVTPASEQGAAGGEPAVEEKAPAEEGDIGKMNDDLWVEIVAQVNYQGGKDPTGWALGGGYEKFLKEKGVTEEQLDAYAKKLEADPTRMAQLTEKIFKRLQELSK